MRWLSRLEKSIRNQYSGQKLISSDAGSSWPAFWLHTNKWSNTHDREQAPLPMQYGVTFNPDWGLCDVTRRYCGESTAV